MVGAMAFSSGVRTRYVSGWASIVWLASAVSVCGSQNVDLQTPAHVVAECGRNVTLTCDASSSRKMDIKLFSWLAKSKIMCNHMDGPHDPEALCESTEETSHHRLSLTLINVMPVHEGNYLCKLQSNMGVNQNSTSVKIQDCLESSSYSNKSNAKCFFTGVYPSGTVHWFQEDVNLTDFARTREEKDQHGRYNIFSEIDAEKGTLSLPYDCSLWIPSRGKYLSSQRFSVDSAGSRVKLQWLCIMVEIMMVRFMT